MHQGNFDEINITTALLHTARLSGSQRKRRCVEDVLVHMSPLVCTRAWSLSSKSLASIFYSFGKLKHHPGAAGLNGLTSRAEELLFHFEIQELKSFMSGLEEICCHTPQYDTYGAGIDQQFFDTLYLVLDMKIENFSPEEVALVFQSLSKLDKVAEMPASLLEQFARHVMQNIESYDVKSLTKALWFSAKHSESVVSREFLEIVSMRLRYNLCRADSNDLATISWSYKNIGFNPGLEFLEEFSVYAGSKARRMKPRDFAVLIHGLSGLKSVYTPSKVFLNLLTQALPTISKKADRHSLVLMCFSLAKLAPTDNSIGVAITTTFGMDILLDTSPQGLLMILCTYQMIDFNPGDDMMDLIRNQMLERADMTPEYLSTALNCFANLEYYPGNEKMNAFIDKGMDGVDLNCFDKASLVRLVSAFGTLNYYPGDEFMFDFVSIVQEKTTVAVMDSNELDYDDDLEYWRQQIVPDVNIRVMENDMDGRKDEHCISGLFDNVGIIPSHHTKNRASDFNENQHHMLIEAVTALGRLKDYCGPEPGRGPDLSLL